MLLLATTTWTALMCTIFSLAFEHYSTPLMMVAVVMNEKRNVGSTYSAICRVVSCRIHIDVSSSVRLYYSERIFFLNTVWYWSNDFNVKNESVSLLSALVLTYFRRGCWGGVEQIFVFVRTKNTVQRTRFRCLVLNKSVNKVTKVAVAVAEIVLSFSIM